MDRNGSAGDADRGRLLRMGGGGGGIMVRSDLGILGPAGGVGLGGRGDPLIQDPFNLSPNRMASSLRGVPLTAAANDLGIRLLRTPGSLNDQFGAAAAGPAGSGSNRLVDEPFSPGHVMSKLHVFLLFGRDC